VVKKTLFFWVFLKTVEIFPLRIPCTRRERKKPGEERKIERGASDIVKVESSGEDPRAIGDLVSNLPHPRFNKTKQERQKKHGLLFSSSPFLFEYMCTRLPFISWSIAGVPGASRLLHYCTFISAAVIGVLPVWIQQHKIKIKSRPRMD